MEPLVTTRTYDYDTKQILESESDMLSFGSITPSLNSDIIIIDCVISNVKSAGELGIGIVSSNLSVGSFPGNLYYSIFDSLDEAVEPTLPFNGISGIDGEEHVVDVGFKSNLTSKYVALMVKSPDDPLTCGCLVLKWFFGFDKEEI
jgi:nucleoside recognition membrane protein YjiH